MERIRLLAGAFGSVLLVCCFLPLFSISQAASPQGITAAQNGYLAPEFLVSIARDNGPHRYRPKVAYNSIHKEYLVVWHYSYDNGQSYIYGRRLDQNGAPIGDFFMLANQVHNSVHPNVVYNPTEDEYLVVWMFDASGNNTKYEIWGSFLPWNATSAATGFRIAAVGSDDLTMWYPSAAWNSIYNYYEVIWNEHHSGKPPGTPIRVNIASVYPNGTIYQLTLTTFGQPTEADIAYSPASDLFMAVWNRLVASLEISGD